MFQRFSPLLEQKSQAYAKAILAKLVTEIDAHERQLCDGGRDRGVRGSHRQDMARTQRRTPQRDPVGIHLRQGTRAADGRPQILELPVDVNQLPRLAFAVSEMPVVEGQDRQPGSLPGGADQHRRQCGRLEGCAGE